MPPDVGLLEDEGWLSMLAKRPITIGHENAGVVAEVGPGVTDFRSATASASAPPPRPAHPATFDGGFASKMTVAAEALVPC